MTDYDALVNELRDCRNMAVYSPYWWDITTKAANAIEELQAGEKKFLRNISALEMENENLKRAGRWIPVAERLPEEDELVLVWRTNQMPYVSRRSDSTYWLGLGRDAGVTHWMPLPTPPKEETE